jgi:hypothetical protein
MTAISGPEKKLRLGPQIGASPSTTARGGIARRTQNLNVFEVKKRVTIGQWQMVSKLFDHLNDYLPSLFQAVA